MTNDEWRMGNNGFFQTPCLWLLAFGPAEHLWLRAKVAKVAKESVNYFNGCWASPIGTQSSAQEEAAVAVCAAVWRLIGVRLLQRLYQCYQYSPNPCYSDTVLTGYGFYIV
uniref:Uncharacterized protein n=1 Tax=Ulva intestinalis TaxID=3116 RepID=A0A8K1HV04_ULVIN|nr:hypothetical protein LK039_mgp17 [Ulva intestinalis]UBR43444.1 hypothetical protein [Ulva intestinalis]